MPQAERPWRINFRAEIYGGDVHNGDGATKICKVYSPYNEDKLLICYAPELLKALQELHAAAWENGCSALLSDELATAARLIEKVKG